MRIGVSENWGGGAYSEDPALSGAVSESPFFRKLPYKPFMTMLGKNPIRRALNKLRRFGIDNNSLGYELRVS